MLHSLQESHNEAILILEKSIDLHQFILNLKLKNVKGYSFNIQIPLSSDYISGRYTQLQFSRRTFRRCPFQRAPIASFPTA